MLLCVAGGGGVTSFKDIPDRRRTFSQQHVFGAGERTDVMDRVSLISSFNQSLQDQHVTYRSKVLLVQEDDSNSKTCIVSRSMYNTATGSSAVVFNYKSRSGNRSFSARGCQVNHVQRPHTPLLHSSSSSALSVSSSSSSSSAASASKQDGVSTSAWAQIMELEGYRSPAVGLDSQLLEARTNDSESEERDNSVPESRLRKRMYRKNAPAGIGVKYKNCGAQYSTSFSPNSTGKRNLGLSFAQNSNENQCSTVYVPVQAVCDPATSTRTISSENPMERKATSSARHICSKNASPEHDPNASWGRYSCRAMRDSVRKVAEKYVQTTYTRSQNGGRLRPSSDGETPATSVRTSSRLFKKQTEPVSCSSARSSNLGRMADAEHLRLDRFSVQIKSQLNDSVDSTKRDLARTDFKKMLCRKCASALESEPLPRGHFSRRRSIDVPSHCCEKKTVVENKTSVSPSNEEAASFVLTKEPSFDLVSDTSEFPCDEESEKQESQVIEFSDAEIRRGSDECWKLTAEEMSQLVNGNPGCDGSYKKVCGSNPSTNKWTKWIQKQKEKRKPVFFIGDAPGSITGDTSVLLKSSVPPKRSLSLFETRRFRNLKPKHNHDEVDRTRRSANGKSDVTLEYCDSENDRSSPVLMIPSGFSVSAHEKNASARRSSSSCSGTGVSRKTLQASGVREEKGISQNDPSQHNGVRVLHGCSSLLCAVNADDVCRHIGLHDLNDPGAELEEENTDPSNDVTEMVTVLDRSGNARNHKGKSVKSRTEQSRHPKFRNGASKLKSSREENAGPSNCCDQNGDTKSCRAEIYTNAKHVPKGENVKKRHNLKEHERGILYSSRLASKKGSDTEKFKDCKNNDKVRETKKSEKSKEIERVSPEGMSEARSDRSIVLERLLRFGNITRTLSLHSLKRKHKQPHLSKAPAKMNLENTSAEGKHNFNLRKCLSYAELAYGTKSSSAVKKSSKVLKSVSVTSGIVDEVLAGSSKCTCLSTFKRSVSLPSSFPLSDCSRRSNPKQRSKGTLGCYHSVQEKSSFCACNRDGKEDPRNLVPAIPLHTKDAHSKQHSQNQRSLSATKSDSRFAFFGRSYAFEQSFLDVNEEIPFNQNNLIMGLGSNHVLIGAADNYCQITMVEENLFTDRTFSSSSDSSPTMSFASVDSTSPIPQFRHKKSSTLSKAEHNSRRKSASESTFRSVRKTLSNVLESQRPTSQFYADLDDQLFIDSQPDPNVSNLCRLSGVSSGSQPILTAANQSYSNPNGTTGMLAGYPSLRTSTPHLSPVDSLMRKFRKSFALRFQKKKTDSHLDPTAEDISTSPDSITDVKCSGSEVRERNHSMVKKPQSPLASPPLSPSKNKGNVENSVLGNFVLRPVRERKNHKMRRDGRFSMFYDGSDTAFSDSIILNKSKCTKPHLAGSDVNILRKRAASTSDYSPKSKALQRPYSVVDYISLDSSSCTKPSENKEDLLGTTHEGANGIDIAQKNGIDQLWRSNPVKLCRVHSRLMMCRNKGRYRLRRSVSHPVELQMAGSINALGESSHCPVDQDSSQKGSLSSDDDVSSDSDMYHNYCCSPTRRSTTCWELSSEGVMYAEALWDHEALDSEELPFQTGDVIEVTDTSDADWWWGTRAGRSGWFPASIVRMYICHRVPSITFPEQAIDGERTNFSPCKTINNNLTCDQIRANIVTEIVATERDYVKHLKDVVEGYLRQVHRRPDMFSNERIETVFGNIEEIYTFQSQFLSRLEERFQNDTPHLSQIGNCFLDHKEEFKMYSQYCNNHSLAVNELQELFSVPKYAQFFEACRLLREMIDISLDGFLLTPIQRICKYPLQLAELLKYTDSNHPDHIPVTKALAAMKEVAELVNERKRRMECLERIAEWQTSIEGWVGPDVLERSSILIHCGEVTRVSSTWSRDVYLFIFDHQLVYCKKDILKRNTYVYKGRLDLDCCDIIDVEDGKDLHYGVNVKNAWKIYYKDKDKWFLFYAKTAPEKDQWLCAFASERQTVVEDKEQGFVVTEDAKKAARLAVLNKQKPKRPRAKFSKGRRCHPDAAVTELLVLDLPSAKARSGSLPSNIHPELAIMAGAKLTPSRKKGSGWFHFGSGKKPKT